MLRLRSVLGMTALCHPAYGDPSHRCPTKEYPCVHGHSGQRRRPCSRPASRPPPAACGLSGVALAAGGSAGSEAGPGLGLGLLVAPAGACDDAGALLGVVGAACQVGTAVLAPAAPGQTGPGIANTPPAGSGQSPASPLRQRGRRARRLHRGLRERRAGRRHAATARFRNRVRRPARVTGGPRSRRCWRPPPGVIQRAAGPGHVRRWRRDRARAPRAHRGTRAEHLR